MSFAFMNDHNTSPLIVIEMIPSDCVFAEHYLQKVVEQRDYHCAINVGIADAEAGKLTSLTTVKAKWLSR